MKSKLSVLLLCLLSVVFVLADAHGQEKRSPSPYGLLHDTWKSEKDKLDEEIPTLSKAVKRKRVHAINRVYTSKFLKLASEHLDDDVWIDCLIWASAEGVKGAALDQMFDLLGSNAQNASNTYQLQLLMSQFIDLPSERIEPALTKIATSHTNESVKGASLYALAARMKRRGERDGDAQVCQASKELLQRVVDEFPDVWTYHGKNEKNAARLLSALQSPVAITKNAPNIQAKAISGDDFCLETVAKGKVAVISFSGHWCGPCVAMHSIQRKLIKQNDTNKLVVIEINSDQKRLLDDVRNKIKEDELTWLVVPDGSEGPISKQWRVSEWPTYFVLDSNGQIRHRLIGNVGDKLTEAVETLTKSGE